ncbi:hypothetical protein HPB51_021724 [Rhipicephalus microplus]|uniref:Uncharacterized protein n=1 Tax=Rhipicephalus microplus TaxID=6941 RepID=A0A9J6DPH7_RHIMP|nr:hypothetical protein HPB51_021724 [Rhipicephalus microplus]
MAEVDTLESGQTLKQSRTYVSDGASTGRDVDRSFRQRSARKARVISEAGGRAKRRFFAASLDSEEETGVQSGLLLILYHRYCDEQRATDSETIGVLSSPAAHQRPPNSPSVRRKPALWLTGAACDRLQHSDDPEKRGGGGGTRKCGSNESGCCCHPPPRGYTLSRSRHGDPHRMRETTVPLRVDVPYNVARVIAAM